MTLKFYIITDNIDSTADRSENETLDEIQPQNRYRNFVL